MRTLRNLKTLLALAFLACATTAYADPPGRVARLNHVSGMVSFAPAEAPGQWVEAVVNRPLTSGDRLWADSNARAELHVGSTAMRLAPQTSVDVLNLDDDTLQLRLAQGAMNLRVRDLARDEIVEVATPTGAVLIRQPGSYRISTDPHGDASRVVVNFGQAEVVTPTQTVTVPSSQSAVLPANTAIAFELAGHRSADEFDRWSAERDRREDQVTATRYVSRDMTGYEDLDQHGSWRTLPEYGAVWIPTRVAHGWAPYRHGHWVWMSPWGWTWVDDAPWGFAPSHYGRWVYVDSYWAWAPGPRVRRPIYAPALVAFVGGPRFSVSIGSGPAVGWFPLGWREPFIPWYRSSHAHVRNVNAHHVHVTNIVNTTNINYVNRRRPDAVTVVSQQTFVSARPVAQASLTVPQTELARAEVIRERPAEPTRASVAPERRGQRPPAQTVAREVVAVNAPAATAARETPAFRDRSAGFARSADDEPRVRVLGRDRRDGPGAERTAQPAAGESERAPQGNFNRDAAPGTHGRASASAPAAPAIAAPGGSNAVTSPAAVRPPANASAAPPSNVPRAAEPESARSRQSLGTRAPAEATRDARRVERQEARASRNIAPSEVAQPAQPPQAAGRLDPRGDDARNEAQQRERDFRRERQAERRPEAAPAREPQMTQSPASREAAPLAPRAPQAAPVREAPRHAPPAPRADAPSPRSAITPRQEPVARVQPAVSPQQESAARARAMTARQDPASRAPASMMPAQSPTTRPQASVAPRPEAASRPQPTITSRQEPPRALAPQRQQERARGERAERGPREGQRRPAT